MKSAPAPVSRSEYPSWVLKLWGIGTLDLLKTFFENYKTKIQNIIDDMKQAKPGEWYSKLKIADNQARISNSYKEVEMTDLLIPSFEHEDIP